MTLRPVRLGRFGPLLSRVGLRWDGSPGHPSVTGADWMVVDADRASPATTATRTVVVDGIVAQRAERQLVLAAMRLGRDAVDVALLRPTPGSEERDWDALSALAERGLARCVGIVTDDPRCVERCRRTRHVDAVWATPAALLAGGELAGVCRWSGTGVLTGAPRYVDAFLSRGATAVAVPAAEVPDLLASNSLASGTAGSAGASPVPG